MAFGDDRKPLKRTAKLQTRTEWPPRDQPRTQLARRVELPRTRIGRQLHQPATPPPRAPRDARRDRRRGGEFTQNSRKQIYRRDEMCVRCGGDPFAFVLGYSAHHRRPRGEGGTRLPWVRRPANGLLVCGTGTTGCHSWIEEHRKDAEKVGWWISPNSDVVAVDVPVLYPVLRQVRLLDNDGGFEVLHELAEGDTWTVEGGLVSAA